MADVKLILFLAALGFIVTIIHIFLRQAGRDEYAYLCLVLGITVALVKVLPLVMELFREVQSVFQYF